MAKNIEIVSLKTRKDLVTRASEFFSDKWGIPKEAYEECVLKYINKETNLPWFIALNDETIVGGLGVIENDFHERKDLTPNICALYVLENYRNQGVARTLISSCLSELKVSGYKKCYLITEHNSFYEKLGFSYLCDTKTDEGDVLRLYQIEI